MNCLFIILILIMFYLHIISEKPIIYYIDEKDWICKNLMK